MQKWLPVQNSNWYKMKMDTLASCWHMAVEGDADCVKKIRCVIHLSSHSTSMFKELHNKLLTKKIVL